MSSIPWTPPLEVADAPADDGPGGYRYDAEQFWTGEVPVQLLECKPHAKGGQGDATSIHLVLGADGPAGPIRWNEYVGLGTEKEFQVQQQRRFLDAFAPGYAGSPAHKAGTPIDLGALPKRWALAMVKKELDTFSERTKNRPKVFRFLGPLPGPTAPDSAKVRAATVAIDQAGPRAAAPGARPGPARAAAPGGAPPSARPAPAPGGVPARPAPPPAAPVQQSLLPPPRAGTPEDASDLPY